MRIPQQTIDEIADKIDMLDYISQDTQLKRKGDRFWGCCPFHHEKTPSFSVVPEKGFYYCFGCHKGGNIYSYIMETAKVDFLEAVKMAAEKSGVKLQMQNDVNPEDRLKKDALYELYRRVTGSFHWILKESAEAEPARTYLKNRGINQESWEVFQLGYAPKDKNWLYRFLQNKNYSTEFLDSSGLFSRNHKGFPLFRNRLMFPIFDHSGREVAFSGRILEGDGPKYINSPETPIYHKKRLLFGLGQTLPFVKESRSFLLCEGNLDVISLYQAGVKNIAAPLGTAFTPEQLKVLKRYCSKGIIAFDSDKAGKNAAKKAVHLCRQQDLPVEVLSLPEGQDPADILLEQGEESLKKMISTPVKAFDFLLTCAVESFDITVPEGKVEVVEELTPYLQSVNSEIERVSYLEKIADRLLLDKNVVLMEFKGKRGIPREREVRKTEKSFKWKMDDEIFLVLLLLLNSSLYPMINNVDIGDLQNDLARELYLQLKEKGPLENKEDWIGLISHPAWEEFLLEKQDDPVFCMNPEEQLNDVARKIRNKSLLKRRDEVGLLLRQEETLNNQRALTELLEEKKRLDEQIEGLRV